jgi:hypothetical protein
MLDHVAVVAVGGVLPLWRLLAVDGLSAGVAEDGIRHADQCWRCVGRPRPNLAGGGSTLDGLVTGPPHRLRIAASKPALAGLLALAPWGELATFVPTTPPRSLPAQAMRPTLGTVPEGLGQGPVGPIMALGIPGASGLAGISTTVAAPLGPSGYRVRFDNTAW